MIISHSKKFIYVHIPKTGGTSIEMGLAPILGWNDLILGSTELGDTMNGPYRRQFGLFDHCTVDDIASVCGAEIFDDYFSFTVVRHPVERAMSSFNYFGRMCWYPCNAFNINLDTLRQTMIGAPEDDPTRSEYIGRFPFLSWGVIAAFLEAKDFSTFIRHPITLSDPTFFPQTEFVCSLDGDMKLDEIVKLEELHRFLPRLSRKLGEAVTIGHENRSRRKLVSAETIGADDKLYLQQYFTQDFLAFEYE